MISVSVCYPKTADSTFDHDYYLQRHMPFVKHKLATLGLEKAELFRGSASLDGSQPPFEMIGFLYFASVEVMQNALAVAGGEIMGDIPNFTNVQPIIQINHPVG